MPVEREKRERERENKKRRVRETKSVKLVLLWKDTNASFVQGRLAMEEHLVDT